MTKTIYFVRHGQTEWNAIARMQGQANSNLNETGRRQADAHGRFLAGCRIDAIHASPLDRARQTTAIVQRHVRLDATYDERIMEWDCGEWSGHRRRDVARRWPGEWASLAADPYHYRGPGCENYPDMIARTEPFIDELLASPAGNIAVISHGMIGRIMVGMLAGFSKSQMLGYKQPNDVIYRVRLPAGSSSAASRTQGPAARGRIAVDHFEAGRGPIAGVVPRD